ncbi:MAG: T9SS type A sorting domain-containing protein [Bacteroidetes bacterium]|nr:T9SS type A sorting domain-containing protein [Bacteroidota bacterium]
MKKFIQLLAFCMISISAWANGNASPDLVCGVSISLDSTNTGDVILTAMPSGDAPFAYIWSTGETTPTVVVTSWGINYCVTVTDANGCVAESCLYNQNSCSASIQITPIGALFANAGGVYPFTYVWSDGSTSSSIFPNAPGNYCVTITDLTGCEASACYSWPSCSVQITSDSLNPTLTAEPTGTAPFTFQWNTGANTQTITVNPNNMGNYCVTVTDANGCISSDCQTFNPCNVYITQMDSAGYDILEAFGNPPSATYLWSTGETSNYIVPSSTGSYCVTVTGGGCTSNACYFYHAPNFTISGYLYFPDSLNNPGPMEGTVELYFNDTNTNTWELVSTTDIESNANGWSNFYDFGAQNSAGDYIVKATLDPNFPGAADYMPTYHFSTVHWDSADVITTPSTGSGLYNIILNDGSNLTGGSGNINGTVTEGEGLTSNGEGERGGSPRPNTSVLLFDSNEQPVTHTLTDGQGQYSFGNLPFGTYKLEVEIVGVEQVERWVTLSSDNPTSEGNGFQVTSEGIVLGIHDLLAQSKVQIFPNPTTGIVNFGFEATSNFDANISLARADGQIVLAENQAIAKGYQTLRLDLTNYPTGLYFLQVTTGNEVISTKLVKQ